MLEYTKEVVYVNDYELAIVKPDELILKNLGNEKITPFITKLDMELAAIEKGGYEHFMLKEIVEQKYTLLEATNYSEAELKPLVTAIKKAKTVYTIGAGTASLAAGQIAFYLRKYAKVKAVELKSYEIESYTELFTKHDLIIDVQDRTFAGHLAGYLRDVRALITAKKNGRSAGQ